MRTIAMVVTIMLLAMTSFFVLAFLYIDLSGHSSFRYDVLKENNSAGKVKVDKYVTEDKIIYKSTIEFSDTLSYPLVNEKLSLKKKTMMPLKFIEEAEGVKGQRRITLLMQNTDKTDFLFLEGPSFITLKDFETGEKTFIFDPADIMLYMPILEKYNFWKGGTQFFEVMIPTGYALPPMRDKVKMSHTGDEYIRVMGQKMEAESFSLTAKSLPTVRFYIAKYTHRILVLEIGKKTMRFVLTDFIESPERRIEPTIDRIVLFFDRFARKITSFKTASETADFSKKQPLKALEAAVPIETAGQQGKVQATEIFFKSDNLMLSGKIWMGQGAGPFPAVVMVPKDGPITKGEKLLLENLAESLAQSNISVIFPDYPGQGKSQKSLTGLDDERKIKTIISAAEHIGLETSVDKNSITLVGHNGGGYIGIKAAASIPSVQTCIVLGMPPGLTDMDFYKETTAENIQAVLAEEGLGPFEENFMRVVQGKVSGHVQEVRDSTDDFAFFMGIRMPLKSYRDLMARDFYKESILCENPVLFILGKDEKGIESKGVKELEKELKRKNPLNEFVLLNNLGPDAGKMENSNDTWFFSINPDVVNLVREWVLKNGIYKEKLPPEGPLEANMP